MEEGRLTTLIVTPMDMEAPGSYRQRRALLQAGAAQESKDGAVRARAVMAVEDVVLAHLSTDDGTPVEEALDRLSAAEFDALIPMLLGEAVDPQSAGS